MSCKMFLESAGDGTEAVSQGYVREKEKKAAPFGAERKAAAACRPTERQARLSAQRESAAAEMDTRWRCCMSNPRVAVVCVREGSL